MAVNLHSTHYRFGINELAESTHGWHAAEDANPAQGVIAVDTTFLLRITVQETGGTAAGNTDQQFQCRLGAGAFQNITTSSTIVKAVTTTVFANGADLTKRLSGTGTFESSGDGGTHDGLSGGAQNDIAASGNSETECALQIVSGDVAHNDVIEFRLTSPDFTITNDVVPTLTVNEPAAVTLAASSAGITVVAGALAVLRGLAGVSGGAAAVSASLSVERPLAGSSAGVASVTAALTVEGIQQLAGTSAGVATVAGSLSVDRPLSAVSAGLASVSGALSVQRQLSGSSAGVASVAGALDVTRGLSGASAGVSGVSGSLAISRGLSGLAAGLSSVSGVLRINVGLAGLSSSATSVTGALTVTAGTGAELLGRALGFVIAKTARAVGSVIAKDGRAVGTVKANDAHATGRVVALMGFMVGGTATFKVEFWNASDVKADPSTVLLYCWWANSQETYTYGTDAEVVKDATGEYHADIILPDAGVARWQWHGTGTVMAKVAGQFGVEEF